MSVILLHASSKDIHINCKYELGSLLDAFPGGYAKPPEAKHNMRGVAVRGKKYIVYYYDILVDVCITMI